MCGSPITQHRPSVVTGHQAVACTGWRTLEVTTMEWLHWGLQRILGETYVGGAHYSQILDYLRIHAIPSPYSHCPQLQLPRQRYVETGQLNSLTFEKVSPFLSNSNSAIFCLPSSCNFFASSKSSSQTYSSFYFSNSKPFLTFYRICCA